MENEKGGRRRRWRRRWRRRGRRSRRRKGRRRRRHQLVIRARRGEGRAGHLVPSVVTCKGCGEGGRDSEGE